MRFTAGSLAGVLGSLRHRPLAALTGAIWAGLAFTAVTDTSAMARVLVTLPHHRASAAHRDVATPHVFSSARSLWSDPSGPHLRHFVICTYLWSVGEFALDPRADIGAGATLGVGVVPCSLGAGTGAMTR